LYKIDSIRQTRKPRWDDGNRDRKVRRATLEPLTSSAFPALTDRLSTAARRFLEEMAVLPGIRSNR
jgi:hypothetical protein